MGEIKNSLQNDKINDQPSNEVIKSAYEAKEHHRIFNVLRATECIITHGLFYHLVTNIIFFCALAAQNDIPACYYDRILCDYPYNCESNPSFWQLSVSCCWPYVQAMAVSEPFCLGDRLSPINTNEIQTREGSVTVHQQTLRDSSLLSGSRSHLIKFGSILSFPPLVASVLFQSDLLGSSLLLVCIVLHFSSSHFFAPSHP